MSFTGWTPPKVLVGCASGRCTYASSSVPWREGSCAAKPMPNVGREGRKPSKKCTGKLLEMPPSENRQRRTRGGPSGASRTSGSARYSGTALTSPGKLRLRRASTTRGNLGPSGRRCRSVGRTPSGPTSAVTSAGPPSATSHATTSAGNSFSNSARLKRCTPARSGSCHGRRDERSVVMLATRMRYGSRSSTSSGAPSERFGSRGPAIDSMRACIQSVNAGRLPAFPSAVVSPVQSPKSCRGSAFSTSQPMRRSSATTGTMTSSSRPTTICQPSFGSVRPAHATSAPGTAANARSHGNARSTPLTNAPARLPGGACATTSSAR